jgi:hypothetical protein
VTAHVERPTRLAGGKTYCACGQPWPCASAPDDDRVASTLAAWRSVVNAPEIPDAPKDWLVTELDAWFIATARNAFPRLLAAIEAALKVADQLPPQGPPSSALEEDRMWIRQECADMIREAITRELTGKEAGDGD